MERNLKPLLEEHTDQSVKKKAYRVLITACLALLCLMAIPRTTQAANISGVDMGNKTKYTVGMTYYPSAKLYMNVYAITSKITYSAGEKFAKEYQAAHPDGDWISAKQEIFKKLKVTNSNPAVLTVSDVSDDGISVILNKAGKSTVTVKGTVAGKKINLTVNITSSKYERPFTSFKINGKSYSKAFKTIHELKLDKWDAKTKTVKVNVKLKKGWTILSQQKGLNPPCWRMTKKTANTMTFKLATSKLYDFYPYCYFELYNKKENRTIQYSIDFSV